MRPVNPAAPGGTIVDTFRVVIPDPDGDIVTEVDSAAATVAYLFDNTGWDWDVCVLIPEGDRSGDDDDEQFSGRALEVAARLVEEYGL